MANIVVCDSCGTQVPNKGNIGPRGWYVLRSADFAGPELHLCSLECILKAVEKKQEDQRQEDQREVTV